VPTWIIRNKIDLDSAFTSQRSQSVFAISASQGDGLVELIAALVGYAQEFFGAADAGMIGRQRQRDLLVQAARSLQRSISVMGEGEELAAEDLRSAAYALGRLLGQVDVEDILDVIFREFCIGK
jgi:tRNA modification GTPase